MSVINMLEKEIMNDKMNEEFTKNNIKPIYQAHKDARIVIIGQAPGLKTQEVGVVFKDQSGKRLREWMGIDEDVFYSNLIAVLPMDFYFPGKAKVGDLPPRKGFAEKWHPLLLKAMPNLKLIILSGKYAIKYYLGVDSVTEAVRNYQSYLPKYFPIIHPSPLNFRWIGKNEWFLDLIPVLQGIVKEILK